MSTSGILVEKIIAILIIMIIGVLCYKTKIIDDITNSKLSNILLTLVQPAMIFTSLQIEFKTELLEGFFISLLLAFVTHIVAIAISYILIRRKKRRVTTLDGKRIVTYVDNEDVEVERIISSYANMGFIGIPLAYGLYGNEGVFYVTTSIIAFNLFIWTHGIIMISGAKKLTFKELLARFKSPSIIAIILGFTLFILRIQLPDVLMQSLDYIGSINTPLAMLIAGATIAKTDVIKMFTKNLRNYYMVFIKLLLIPFILMLMYVWLPIDEPVKMLAIIMAATPTTTIGTILTIRYNKNSILAAEVYAMTTILCAFTIPFIIRIAELLM